MPLDDLGIRDIPSGKSRPKRFDDIDGILINAIPQGGNRNNILGDIPFRRDIGFKNILDKIPPLDVLNEPTGQSRESL